MKYIDLIRLSYQVFRHRISRTLLTILGVSLGIGAILFLVSLGYGLQKIIFEKIATSEALLSLDIATPIEAKIFPLTKENLRKIEQIEGVEKVSAQALLPAYLSFQEITSETTANLVSPDYFALSGLLPIFGNVISNPNEVVVTTAVADLLGQKPEDLINQELSFTFFVQEEESFQAKIIEIKQRFKVVGVLDNALTNQVFLSLTDLAEIPIKEYQFAKVKVVNDQFLDSTREKLIQMGLVVSAISDTLDQASKIFRALQVILAVFGIIALVVAAVGLVNTMTISLLERTQDIGIMRALGASRADIRKTFLTESALMGFLGGVGGILIGILSAEIFNAGINFLASLLGSQTIVLFYRPLWFMVFIVLFSTLIGLGSGIFPARKASKLKPLDALRYK
jgi:putative ABC transport system permease protein